MPVIYGPDINRPKWSNLDHATQQKCAKNTKTNCNRNSHPQRDNNNGSL